MNVRVFLKSPLHPGRGSTRDHELNAAVTEVVGEATARDGGLDIVVSAFHDSRGGEVTCPWPRIFVPLGKVDIYVIE